MKSTIFIFILCHILQAPQVQAQSHGTADSIYQLIKLHSIYSQQVDWNAIDSLYNHQCSNSKSLDDSMHVFSEIFRMLGDHRALIVYAGQEIKPHLKTGQKTAAAKEVPLQIGIAKEKIYRTKLLQDIAYIRIPDLAYKDTASANRQVQALYDSIVLYTPELIKGYIIDLRLCSGGNLIAYLAGISPLIGDGPAVKEIDASGRVVKTWNVKACNVYEDTLARSHIKCHKLDPIQSKPVVVLIGPNTSGVGNYAAIALKRRPNTYFVGEDTDSEMPGLTKHYQIGSDLVLQLSTRALADRANTLFPEKVSPDKQVQKGDRYDQLLSDKKIRAAIEWFSKR